MRLHTVANYFQQRQNIIAANEQIIGYAYADSKGIATIGIGLNLAAYGRLVLQTLGFDLGRTALTGQADVAEQGYIRDLLALFGQKWPSGTGPSNALAEAIWLKMTARANDPAYAAFPAFPRPSDLVLTDTQSFSLLNQLLDVGYSILASGKNQIVPPFDTSNATQTSKLDTWLREEVGGISAATVNPALLAQNSYERLALVSLSYNSFGLLGSRLKQALINDDRAEAWFEIRYDSNGGSSRSAGIASRRYGEAALFGLYNDLPTEADYIAIYRMYTRHKNDVIDGVSNGLVGYESVFAPTVSIRDLLSEATAGLKTTFGAATVAWDDIIAGSGSVLSVTGGGKFRADPWMERNRPAERRRWR